jgi:hypothetical protein
MLLIQLSTPWAAASALINPSGLSAICRPPRRIVTIVHTGPGTLDSPMASHTVTEQPSFGIRYAHRPRSRNVLSICWWRVAACSSRQLSDGERHCASSRPARLLLTHSGVAVQIATKLAPEPKTGWRTVGLCLSRTTNAKREPGWDLEAQKRRPRPWIGSRLQILPAPAPSLLACGFPESLYQSQLNNCTQHHSGTSRCLFGLSLRGPNHDRPYAVTQRDVCQQM